MDLKSDLRLNPVAGAAVKRLTASLPGSILLSGDEGVGLSTIARTIARRHTKNVISIVPEKGTITIDAIRALYAAVRTDTGVTVILIDDADTMGREASNALLKLLEEPGPQVRFILTSHRPDNLLPTVLSRVQRIEIPVVSRAQTDDVLDNLGITDHTKRAQLHFIAGGLPAALYRLAADDDLFATRSKAIRDARSFLSGNREERLILAAACGNDRDAAIRLIRDMMRLMSLSKPTTMTDTPLKMLDTLLLTERDLRENSSVRLSLSLAALQV